MKAIVYISQSLVTFNKEQLTELTDTFAENNKAKGITGYLFYYNDSFFQYIEGPETKIDKLMAVIKADERHEVQRYYEDIDLGTRRFHDWGMKYIDSDTFPQIGLEHIIKGHFEYIDSNIGFESRWVERIWIATTKLAETVN